ncbi:hypothetical protein Scep_027869 [Stephania cephalantha]|uniref:Uncharacterized protein n=1 Tax=Stephania cephalantha TaxID=152367 RepID=A0AAP0EDF1_9MAGN
MDLRNLCKQTISPEKNQESHRNKEGCKWVCHSNEVNIFREPINNNQEDRFATSFGQPFNKVH